MKTVRDVVAPAANSADVSVTKTDSPDPVIVGNNLTYTLNVHNAGPTAAAAVTLTDPLPAGLTLVSATTTKGTCSGTTTISCTIGTVNSGTANDVTVTIVATVGRGRGPEHHEHGHGLDLDVRPDALEQPGERADDRQPAPPT